MGCGFGVTGRRTVPEVWEPEAERSPPNTESRDEAAAFDPVISGEVEPRRRRKRSHACSVRASTHVVEDWLLQDGSEPPTQIPVLVQTPQAHQKLEICALQRNDDLLHRWDEERRVSSHSSSGSQVLSSLATSSDPSGAARRTNVLQRPPQDDILNLLLEPLSPPNNSSPRTRYTNVPRCHTRREGSTSRNNSEQLGSFDATTSVSSLAPASERSASFPGSHGARCSITVSELLAPASAIGSPCLRSHHIPSPGPELSAPA
eukprot:TRINITY_DN11377_c0_g1_i1.p1 TRINITY_DN11377_c0_g1~~TRINITY_DN11377_c0_g1_i1.p1  ORF type:complete len:261 (-),score=22.47 TRINITY_DN11377_c0_g1_i1:625-1407(-)